MDDVYLTEALRWRCEALRRSDPHGRPILAHLPYPIAGSSREWRYAEPLDVFGSSCYPSAFYPGNWDYDFGTPETPMSEAAQVRGEIENIVMWFDQVRSSKADRSIWAAELQGGAFTSGLGRLRVPTSLDIRRWVLSCLAAGARGICYWNHRPEMFWKEGYGFGLLDWGSQLPARAEEAGRFATALTAHAELFAKGAHPEPSVGIVLNEALYHFVEGSPFLGQKGTHCKDHLQYTITGIWRGLWRQGVPVGFVDGEAIPQNAATVKALILPFPLTLGEAQVRALRTYVEAGGTLICEACPGRFDKYGIGFIDSMAPGVSEIFGAKHRDVAVIREPGHGATWTDWRYGPRDFLDYQELEGVGTFAGLSVFPAFYLQTLELTTATPLLTSQSQIVGCANKLGKGGAYLLGTLIGHAGPAYNDWRNAEFVSAVLARVGVLPDRVGRLNRRRRELGSQVAWFFFNPNAFEVEETVSIEGFRVARDLLTEELEIRGGKVRLRVKPLDICCVVLGG